MSSNYLIDLLSKVGIVSWQEANTSTVDFGFTSTKEPWKKTYADGVIYALIDARNVVYIGCTINQARRKEIRIHNGKPYTGNTRLSGHRYKKQYDRVLICHIAHEDLHYITDFERCMILRFTPKYNNQFYPPKKYNF